jgi:hypothetical protein
MYNRELSETTDQIKATCEEFSGMDASLRDEISRLEVRLRGCHDTGRGGSKIAVSIGQGV